jgi:hypothetical protein
MTAFRLLLLAGATAALVGCASSHLPPDVRTVSFAPSATRPPIVLAPANASTFARMAEERGTTVANLLRASFTRELAAAGRFQPAPSGRGDAEIAIDTLRHGLIEVSAGNFAVSAGGSLTISRGGKVFDQREFSATSGQVLPLRDFEDPAKYEEALQSTFDKIAIEVVSTL